MELSYHKEPFPHIVGTLDDDLYKEVCDSWASVVHNNYSEMAGNRSNIPMPDGEMRQKINSVMFNCYNTFVQDYIECYPKLIETPDFKIGTRILYSENKASDDGYKIRGWHLDTGDKLMVGLWYCKHPDEEDDGGDLLLMNPQTKEYKTIKYGSNVFVMFPNLMTAWHAVSPRKPSKYPRRYINLLLESPDIKFHNYQRTGTTVDSEYRGKLENYFK